MSRLHLKKRTHVGSTLEQSFTYRDLLRSPVVLILELYSSPWDIWIAVGIPTVLHVQYKMCKVYSILFGY